MLCLAMSLLSCSAQQIKCPPKPAKIDLSNPSLNLADLQIATILRLQYDRDIKNGCTD